MTEVNFNANISSDIMAHADDAQLEVDHILGEIRNEIVQNDDVPVDQASELGVDSFCLSKN